MKRIFVMILLAGASVSLLAQNTRVITGGVVDKYGNPISGAKVEATGGAESTITDADGSFSIEVSRWLKSLTATYPGMKSKKKTLVANNNEVVFTLRKSNGSSLRWFINALYQYDANYETGSFGLMGGQLGDWGWYGKIMLDMIHLPCDYVNYHYYSASGAYSEHGRNYYEKADAAPSISIGIIKSISSQFYTYLGLGYSQCYYESSYGRIEPSFDYFTWMSYYYENNFYDYFLRDALLIDLGLMYKTNHFNFNLGISYRRMFDHFFERNREDDGRGIHVGVGYAF